MGRGQQPLHRLFEAHVIQWLKEASIHAVSRQLKLSWTAIDGIMDRAVNRGLAVQKTPDTRYLAVDETAFKKGHDYVTIVSNHQEKVLAVEDGKFADSLSGYYQSISTQQKNEVISVLMDMSQAYQKATFAHINNARRKIAFDHFHIAQSLNNALNATRKHEMRSVDATLRQQVDLHR